MSLDLYFKSIEWIVARNKTTFKVKHFIDEYSSYIEETCLLWRTHPEAALIELIPRTRVEIICLYYDSGCWFKTNKNETTEAWVNLKHTNVSGSLTFVPSKGLIRQCAFNISSEIRSYVYQQQKCVSSVDGKEITVNARKRMKPLMIAALHILTTHREGFEFTNYTLSDSYILLRHLVYGQLKDLLSGDLICLIVQFINIHEDKGLKSRSLSVYEDESFFPL